MHSSSEHNETKILQKFEELKAAYDSSPIGLCVLDRELHYIRVNVTLARINGLPVKEHIGKTPREAIPYAFSERIESLARSVIEKGEPIHDIELSGSPAEDPEKISFWNTHMQPIRGSDGQVLAVNITVEDITKRKIAEVERARLTAILESTSDLVATAKPDGQLTFLNTAGRQMLGWDEDEDIRGHNLSDAHQEWVSKIVWDEGITTALIHGTWKGETVILNRTGREIPVSQVIMTHRSANGELESMSTIMRDISEQKQAEEELRRHRDHLEELVKKRTSELEARNMKLNQEIAERRKAEEEKRRVESHLAQIQRIEALDRFAGGIAHDLNNILYPIIVNTEELLAEAPLDSSMHELLDQTMKAALRQRDLIKKILSFGRRSDQVLEPIKLIPLIEETIDFLRSTLPSTIEIKQHIDSLTDTIMGDPTQIQQVIMNLCRNAADALVSQKGTITVGLTETHLEPVHIHQNMKAGDYLALTVGDTGMGIAPEVMTHIFDPFFTTKQVGEGNGMGLSIVHGILKNHGGAVTVESKPGEGSLFTVYLPLCIKEEETLVSSPENSLSAQGKERVLLIDDEEIILSSLKRVLKMSGYRVVAVKDGVEAFRLFSRTPDEFDLIITDLTMPKMTGIELAGKILKIRPDVPVILCTGFNDAISEQEAKSLGISELLMKPSGSRELRKTVRRALDQ